MPVAMLLSKSKQNVKQLIHNAKGCSTILLQYCTMPLTMSWTERGLTFLLTQSVQRPLNSRSPMQPAHALQKHRRLLPGLLLWHYKLLEQSLFH